MRSGSEAEARCEQAVWSLGIARIFAVIVDVLSDIHDAFIFGPD